MSAMFAEVPPWMSTWGIVALVVAVILSLEIWLEKCFPIFRVEFRFVGFVLLVVTFLVAFIFGGIFS
jgi:hypothetical protein